MFTENNPILAPTSAQPDQAIGYILARGSIYSPDSIATIVGHYWRFAPEVGIDPVLAIAQCIHETSERDPATGKWLPLSSWWAQRPRRNPAGLGVTGRTERSEPRDAATAWAFDDRTGVWRHGLSFPSWHVSSRAHLGRLLAYALTDEQMDQAQRSLMDEALSWRPFPADLRGTAPILKQLGARHNPKGRGWAFPGDTYGRKIAEVARAIVEFSGSRTNE